MFGNKHMCDGMVRCVMCQVIHCVTWCNGPLLNRGPGVGGICTWSEIIYMVMHGSVAYSEWNRLRELG